MRHVRELSDIRRRRLRGRPFGMTGTVILMLFCVPARSTVHVDLGPAKDVRPHSFDFRLPHFLWVGLLGQLVEREADRALYGGPRLLPRPPVEDIEQVVKLN